jgi:hypothetical protein
MHMVKHYGWCAGLSLVAFAGCGYDPYPTPKPVVTPGIDSPYFVKRATYDASVPPGPPVLRVERPPAPIIRPFEEWTEQEVAADTLGRIGPPAIPYLQQSLRSSNPVTRKQAAEVLGRMGSDAAPAVNDLVALLDDPDPEVRKVAARTLGRIGPDSAPAIPALMRALIQEDASSPPAVPAPLAPPPAGPPAVGPPAVGPAAPEPLPLPRN